MVVRPGKKHRKGRLVKKSMLVIGAVLVLSACASRPVPDSGAGVGFGDYQEYEIQRARREAELRGDIPSGPVVAPGTDPLGGNEGFVTTNDLNQAGIGDDEVVTEARTPTRPPSDEAIANGRSGFVEASPANDAPEVFNNPGISDEQDFTAVSSRESIESDAARRQQQQAAYQVVTPTAVPERSGRAGPNIVQYALEAPNAKGQEWYSRSLLSGQNRFQRNCAKYANPDAAQRDFLARGGPERDRLGLDPDGDGFACGWDPAPFRLAAQSAAASN